MRPFKDAQAAFSGAASSIPAAAWRSLQSAVALFHMLQQADGHCPGTGEGSLPPQVAADLTAAELALLQRHLTRLLTCPPSALLMTGPTGSSAVPRFSHHISCSVIQQVPLSPKGPE